MLKQLAVLIVTCLLVAYSWGWVTDVYFGSMSTERYTACYFSDVKDIWEHLLMGLEQAPKVIGKPLPRRHLEYSERDLQ